MSLAEGFEKHARRMRISKDGKKLYGIDDKATERTGRNCLLARRLAERAGLEPHADPVEAQLQAASEAEAYLARFDAPELAALVDSYRPLANSKRAMCSASKPLAAADSARVRAACARIDCATACSMAA
mgnify:CR=1 FL=1